MFLQLFLLKIKNMKRYSTALQLVFLSALFITLQSAGCKKDEVGPSVSPMIGTTGPGGGIVYYDQGYYAGGWRYLEVSATDMPMAKWGKSGITVHANEFLVGEGYRNNQRLLDSCLIPGETIAAEHCANYVSNGYSDWHMPSLGDYRKMHENLYIKGMGNFNDSYSYWTANEGCNSITGVWFHFSFNQDGSVNRSNSKPSRAVRRF